MTTMELLQEIVRNINNAADTSAKDFFTLLAFAAVAIGFIGSYHINEWRKQATDSAVDTGKGIWDEMGHAYDIFFNSGSGATGGSGDAGFDAVREGIKDMSGVPFQNQNNSNNTDGND